MNCVKCEHTANHLKCFEESNAYIGEKVYFFCSTKLKRSTVYIDARSSHTNKRERTRARKRLCVNFDLCTLFPSRCFFLLKKSQEDSESYSKSPFERLPLTLAFAMMFLCSYWFQKFSHVISAFRVLSNWVSRGVICLCLFVIHRWRCSSAQVNPLNVLCSLRVHQYILIIINTYWIHFAFNPFTIDERWVSASAKWKVIYVDMKIRERIKTCAWWTQ